MVQLPGYETTGRGIYNNFDERARINETSLYALNGTVNRHQYQFNAANQRTRQTFFQGHFSDYTYDKIGQLKTAKGWESDSTTPRRQEQFGYAYDAAWNLAYRTNNALVQTFRANTLNQITNVTRSGTFTVAGTASEPRGGLLARTDNGAYSGGLSSAHAYYHADGNGNITSLIDTSGAVVASYTYDPYGNMLSMSGPLAEANLYRFSSKEAHPNSGLIYYLYRYYEPNLQRWVNRDPWGEFGGLSLYEFAYSAPMNWIDPWGEGCWNPFDPEFWADLFGGSKKPTPPDPNSNRALLNEEGMTPGTFTDENGNEISGGKCTALVCGAVAAGVLTAMTDGLGGSLGKGEKLGSDAMKARKAARAVEDAAKQFKKLSPGEIKKLKMQGLILMT